MIESLESKTAEGGPVFNRISWQPGWQQDRWFMAQSHAGPQLSPDRWDQIGIIVEKGPRAAAKFFQWLPGSSAETGDLKTMPLKVACYTCHPGGPRAIRPDLSSVAAPISLWTRLRLALWNLRIKSYGKVTSTADEPADFRHNGRLANEQLNVPTCNKCHGAEGVFARGPLTRQNYMTIDFMVERGFMPPPGFALPQQDLDLIRKFVGRL